MTEPSINTLLESIECIIFVRRFINSFNLVDNAFVSYPCLCFKIFATVVFPAFILPTNIIEEVNVGVVDRVDKCVGILVGVGMGVGVGMRVGILVGVSVDMWINVCIIVSVLSYVIKINYFCLEMSFGIRELKQEVYPYRTPVFHIERENGFSKIRVNNIELDNTPSNVSYNNNSISFLRRIKLLSNNVDPYLVTNDDKIITPLDVTNAKESGSRGSVETIEEINITKLLKQKTKQKIAQRSVQRSYIISNNWRATELQSYSAEVGKTVNNVGVDINWNSYTKIARDWSVTPLDILGITVPGSIKRNSDFHVLAPIYDVIDGRVWLTAMILDRSVSSTLEQINVKFEVEGEQIIRNVIRVSENINGQWGNSYTVYTNDTQSYNRNHDAFCSRLRFQILRDDYYQNRYLCVKIAVNNGEYRSERIILPKSLKTDVGTSSNITHRIGIETGIETYFDSYYTTSINDTMYIRDMRPGSKTAYGCVSRMVGENIRISCQFYNVNTNQWFIDPDYELSSSVLGVLASTDALTNQQATININEVIKFQSGTYRFTGYTLVTAMAPDDYMTCNIMIENILNVNEKITKLINVEKSLNRLLRIKNSPNMNAPSALIDSQDGVLKSFRYLFSVYAPFDTNSVSSNAWIYYEKRGSKRIEYTPLTQMSGWYDAYCTSSVTTIVVYGYINPTTLIENQLSFQNYGMEQIYVSNHNIDHYGKFIITTAMENVRLAICPLIHRIDAYKNNSVTLNNVGQRWNYTSTNRWNMEYYTATTPSQFYILNTPGTYIFSCDVRKSSPLDYVATKFAAYITYNLPNEFSMTTQPPLPTSFKTFTSNAGNNFYTTLEPNDHNTVMIRALSRPCTIGLTNVTNNCRMSFTNSSEITLPPTGEVITFAEDYDLIGVKLHYTKPIGWMSKHIPVLTIVNTSSNDWCTVKVLAVGQTITRTTTKTTSEFVLISSQDTNTHMAGLNVKILLKYQGINIGTESVLYTYQGSEKVWIKFNTVYQLNGLYVDPRKLDIDDYEIRIIDQNLVSSSQLNMEEYEVKINLTVSVPYSFIVDENNDKIYEITSELKPYKNYKAVIISNSPANDYTLYDGINSQHHEQNNFITNSKTLSDALIEYKRDVNGNIYTEKIIENYKLNNSPSTFYFYEESFGANHSTDYSFVVVNSVATMTLNSGVKKLFKLPVRCQNMKCTEIRIVQSDENVLGNIVFIQNETFSNQAVLTSLSAKPIYVFDNNFRQPTTEFIGYYVIKDFSGSLPTVVLNKSSTIVGPVWKTVAPSSSLCYSDTLPTSIPSSPVTTTVVYMNRSSVGINIPPALEKMKIINISNSALIIDAQRSSNIKVPFSNLHRVRAVLENRSTYMINIVALDKTVDDDTLVHMYVYNDIITSITTKSFINVLNEYSLINIYAHDDSGQLNITTSAPQLLDKINYLRSTTVLEPLSDITKLPKITIDDKYYFPKFMNLSYISGGINYNEYRHIDNTVYSNIVAKNQTLSDIIVTSPKIKFGDQVSNIYCGQSNLITIKGSNNHVTALAYYDSITHCIVLYNNVTIASEYSVEITYGNHRCYGLRNRLPWNYIPGEDIVLKLSLLSGEDIVVNVGVETVQGPTVKSILNNKITMNAIPSNCTSVTIYSVTDLNTTANYDVRTYSVTNGEFIVEHNETNKIVTMIFYAGVTPMLYCSKSLGGDTILKLFSNDLLTTDRTLNPDLSSGAQKISKLIHDGTTNQQTFTTDFYAMNDKYITKTISYPNYDNEVLGDATLSLNNNTFTITKRSNTMYIKRKLPIYSTTNIPTKYEIVVGESINHFEFKIVFNDVTTTVIKPLLIPSFKYGDTTAQANVEISKLMYNGSTGTTIVPTKLATLFTNLSTTTEKIEVTKCCGVDILPEITIDGIKFVPIEFEFEYGIQVGTDIMIKTGTGYGNSITKGADTYYSTVCPIEFEDIIPQFIRETHEDKNVTNVSSYVRLNVGKITYPTMSNTGPNFLCDFDDIIVDGSSVKHGLLEIVSTDTSVQDLTVCNVVVNFNGDNMSTTHIKSFQNNVIALDSNTNVSTDVGNFSYNLKFNRSPSVINDFYKTVNKNNATLEYIDHYDIRALFSEPRIIHVNCNYEADVKITNGTVVTMLKKYLVENSKTMSYGSFEFDANRVLKIDVGGSEIVLTQDTISQVNSHEEIYDIVDVSSSQMTIETLDLTVVNNINDHDGFKLIQAQHSSTTRKTGWEIINHGFVDDSSNLIKYNVNNLDKNSISYKHDYMVTRGNVQICFKNNLEEYLCGLGEKYTFNISSTSIAPTVLQTNDGYVVEAGIASMLYFDDEGFKMATLNNVPTPLNPKFFETWNNEYSIISSNTFGVGFSKPASESNYYYTPELNNSNVFYKNIRISETPGGNSINIPFRQFIDVDYNTQRLANDTSIRPPLQNQMLTLTGYLRTKLNTNTVIEKDSVNVAIIINETVAVTRSSLMDKEIVINTINKNNLNRVYIKTKTAVVEEDVNNVRIFSGKHIIRLIPKVGYKIVRLDDKNELNSLIVSEFDFLDSRTDSIMGFGRMLNDYQLSGEYQFLIQTIIYNKINDIEVSSTVSDVYIYLNLLGTVKMYVNKIGLNEYFENSIQNGYEYIKIDEHIYIDYETIVDKMYDCGSETVYVNGIIMVDDNVLLTDPNCGTSVLEKVVRKSDQTIIITKREFNGTTSNRTVVSNYYKVFGTVENENNIQYVNSIGVMNLGVNIYDRSGQQDFKIYKFNMVQNISAPIISNEDLNVNGSNTIIISRPYDSKNVVARFSYDTTTINDIIPETFRLSQGETNIEIISREVVENNIDLTFDASVLNYVLSNNLSSVSLSVFGTIELKSTKNRVDVSVLNKRVIITLDTTIASIQIIKINNNQNFFATNDEYTVEALITYTGVKTISNILMEAIVSDTRYELVPKSNMEIYASEDSIRLIAKYDPLQVKIPILNGSENDIIFSISLKAETLSETTNLIVNKRLHYNFIVPTGFSAYSSNYIGEIKSNFDVTIKQLRSLPFYVKNELLNYQLVEGEIIFKAGSKTIQTTRYNKTNNIISLTTGDRIDTITVGEDVIFLCPIMFEVDEATRIIAAIKITVTNGNKMSSTSESIINVTTNEENVSTSNGKYILSTIFITPGKYKDLESLQGEINNAIKKSLLKTTTEISDIMFPTKSYAYISYLDPSLLVFQEVINGLLTTINMILEYGDFNISDKSLNIHGKERTIIYSQNGIIDMVRGQIDYTGLKALSENAGHTYNDYEILDLRIVSVRRTKLLNDSFINRVISGGGKTFELIQNRNKCDIKCIEDIVPIRFETDTKNAYNTNMYDITSFDQNYLTEDNIEYSTSSLPRVLSYVNGKLLINDNVMEYIKEYNNVNKFYNNFSQFKYNLWFKLGISPMILKNDNMTSIDNLSDYYKFYHESSINKIRLYTVIGNKYNETIYNSSEITLPHSFVRNNIKYHPDSFDLNDYNLFSKNWLGEISINLKTPRKISLAVAFNKDVEQIINNEVSKNSGIMDVDISKKVGEVIDFNLNKVYSFENSDHIYLYIDSAEHYPFVTGTNGIITVEYIK